MQNGNHLRTTLNPLHLTPDPRPSALQCPRQESNLVYDLRTVACFPAHSEDMLLLASRQGVEPRLAESKSAVLSVTLARCRVARPGIEPGPTASEARAPPCSGGRRSSTLTSHVQKSIPTWNRTRTKTLGKSRAVRYTIGTQEPTTGFAPASNALQERCLTQSSHVGIKHERKESNPVRQLWKLAALPGAHSHIPRVTEGSRTLTFCFTGRRAETATLRTPC